MDTISKDERSKLMAKVKSKDTKPEMAVRRLVHGMGYRYRLHSANLPGHPDLVFASRRKVIFMHGCFWHMHKGCPNTRLPKSRVLFWKTKLESNRKRDILNKRKLTLLGWDYLIIWECELKDIKVVVERIRSFLGDGK